MDPEIQKAVESGKLTPAAASVLANLQPGAFCLHRSWGLGTVADLNLLLNQITIDFPTKKGHNMQLVYAAESLKPLPGDHVLARIATDADGIRSLAKQDAAGLMRQVLSSFGGRASQDKIAEILVPSVFSDGEFKKWWTGTKKALKKDGHFDVPARRTDPIILRDEPLARTDELTAVYHASNQLKGKITALNEIIKNLAEFKDPAAQLKPLIEQIDAAARQSQNLNQSETVELLLARDEIIARFPELAPAGESLAVPALARRFGANLPAVLEALPSSKQRGLLNAVKTAFGDDWTRIALNLIHTGSIRVGGETAKILLDEGHRQLLLDALRGWIRERSISTETLLWLCRERKRAFPELMEPGLFSAVLSSLERDQFNERRTSKLQDLLIDDKGLMDEIMQGTDRDTAREVMRRLMLTPVFEELSKRSLLARIIKLHPGLETMLTGGEATRQEGLVVSWTSLKRKKEELEELTTKRIPQNSEEIRIAREYGDLRENFEFKAAKQMQDVLTRRRAELEQEIGRSRGTDFANPDTSQVSIGTVVTIRDTAGGQTRTYTILGAWDSAPDRHILSYLTATAQALLGKQRGQTVILPDEDGERTVEVVQIDGFVPGPDFEI